ncbi:MAG TPA: hypothetical protein VG015_05640 [Candidatus Dormibacteraeota bacterium]|jgi:hypothetical protein|nr:hypothetical protein [Candidatus Dormibacteraeota bacterium]
MNRLRLLVPTVLALTACGYLVTAWQLPPSFYDTLSGCPSSTVPYAWTNPPAAFKSNNVQPTGGEKVIHVTNGQTDPGTMFTGDGQAQVSWIAGSFALPASGNSVTIDLKPVSSFPDPAGLHVSTNVYQVTSTTPIVGSAVVNLYYQQGIAAPSIIFESPEGTSQWDELSSQPSLLNDCSVHATVRSDGFVFLGFHGSSQSSGQSSQLLPYVVAGAIGLVLLAGLPLALIRRRGDEPGS